jgi:hypothetical protein
MVVRKCRSPQPRRNRRSGKPPWRGPPATAPRAARGHAHQCLSMFLRMQPVQNAAKTKGGRLLRILFLRIGRLSETICVASLHCRDDGQGPSSGRRPSDRPSENLLRSVVLPFGCPASSAAIQNPLQHRITPGSVVIP